MRLSIGAVAAFFIIVLGGVVPCSAQDTPFAEISGGYNFLRYQQLSSGVSLKKGVYFDVAGNLTPVVGVVGQMTGNSLNPVGLQTYMAGLRFNGRGFGRGGGRAVGFFQALGGLMRSKFEGVADNENAIELGGGANIMVTNQAGIRIEGDLIRTFSKANAAVGDNFFRIAFGATYGFGSR